jgi:hypothetical protein
MGWELHQTFHNVHFLQGFLLGTLVGLMFGGWRMR